MQVSGLAQDEIRLEHILGTIWRRAFSLNVGHQRIKCEPSQLRLRHLNGGERWNHELRQPNIVKANYRHVLRNCDVGFVTLSHHTDRRHVIRAHYGSGAHAVVQQFRESRHPAFHRVIAFDHQGRVNV